MNPERDYVSVIIPIHEYFLPKNKNKKYEDKIISILNKNPLTLTKLSYAMGYKGISKKLRDTVNYLEKINYIDKTIIDKEILYSSKK